MPDTIVPPIILPTFLRQSEQATPSLLQHQEPRTPFNLTIAQPSKLRSLRDTPSSPKLKLLKKSSLEEEYFLGSTSDIESKTDVHEDDQAHSDSDLCSLRVLVSPNKRNLQRFAQNPREIRGTSFSLDQGLNFIGDGENEDESREERSSKAFQFKNIPSLASASFPNLTTARTQESDDSSPVTEAPLANIYEQTTQLLQSWHENDPSPYHSFVTGSSSSEKLEGVDRKGGSPSVGPESKSPGDANGVLSRDKSHPVPNCVDINADSRGGGGPQLKEISEVETFQRRLVKEMGLSFPDFVLEEDSFLDDVASRTANLACRNCSFKLSFSRQSTQE